MSAESMRKDSGTELLRRMAARRRRDNIVVTIVAILAVLGGGHAVIDAFSTPPPGPSDNSTIALISRSRLAEAFAREFVVTYLSANAGQRDRIADFLSTPPQGTLPATSRPVTDPIVVYSTRSLSESNVDVWTVTVSVRVVRRAGVAEEAREYYRVAVSVMEGRLRALAAPAAVAPPARGLGLALRYSTACATDSPLAQVAAGFLQALLTGNGDLARYVTTDSVIESLRPAPFSTVEQTTTASDDAECGVRGDQAQVMVTATPKVDGAVTPALSYPLTMVRVAGQWQVRSMDPFPALQVPVVVSSGQQGREGNTGSVTPTRTAPSSAAQIPSATQN
ncbi:conjugal transfer protein [Nocardia tengchongensis]|uniref:conjugal transfer protein n=1 Tax=Nocardia tengchongensis TaxID=2055889 RepID=UPI0036934AC6